MSNEQIKDIIIAMIENKCIPANSYDNFLENIVKAYAELSTKC